MAAGAVQRFIAQVSADASQAVAEFRRFEGETKKTVKASGKELSKTQAMFTRVKVAAAAVGVVAATSLGRQAVNAARDLNESVNAVQVSYGSAAGAVLKIGENADHAAGLSKRAFNEAAVAVGGFVSEIAGETGRGQASVLDELITRASDFASVFNIDVQEALQRFRSGLAGETEPLRRFGINLLQSEVNSYAFANGIAEVGSKLTESEKVTARYGLLLEKTDKFQGDFKNTSGELANQQRILRAETENLAAEFGEALVPGAIGAVGILRDLVAVLDAVQVPEGLKWVAEFISGKEVDTTGAIKETIDGTRISLERFIEVSQGARRGLGFSERLKADIDTISSKPPWEWYGDRYSEAAGIKAFEAILSADAEAAKGLALSFVELEAQSRGPFLSSQRFIRDEMGLTKDAADALATAMAKSIPWRIPTPDIPQLASQLKEGVRRKFFENLGIDVPRTPALFQDTSEDRLGTLSVGARALAIATGEYADEQERAAAAADRAEKRMEELNTMLEEQEQAYRDAIDAALDHADALFGQEEAEIKLTQAKEDHYIRLLEHNELMEDATASDFEKKRSADNLRLSEMALAEQVWENALATAEEAGATEGSAAWHAIMQEELEKHAEEYGPLRDEVDKYLEVLRKIPRDIETKVTLNVMGHIPAVAGLAKDVQRTGVDYVIDDVLAAYNSRGAGALGGIVTRPTLSLIGEAGPEAVIPLHRMPGASPLPSGRIGSGVHITVNTGVGDPVQIGREITQVLERYQRAGGRLAGA